MRAVIYSGPVVLALKAEYVHALIYKSLSLKAKLAKLVSSVLLFLYFFRFSIVNHVRVSNVICAVSAKN